MKRRTPLIITLAAPLLLVMVSPALAGEIPRPEPYTGSVLCAPGMAGECLSLGPDAFRRQMAAQGIRLPYEPLQASAPDYRLRFLPYLYGQVVTQNAPVYGSMEDASRARNPIYRMEGSFSYISYEYTEVVDEMRVYMIAPGVWMNAVDVHRIGTPNFQGLVFSRTPRNPFGWILTPVETRNGPGYAGTKGTGRWLNRLNIVQVYAIQMVGDTEWIKVDPGQWIEKRFAGLIRPRSAPPSEQIEDRWIEVDLSEQTVSVYERGRLVFGTLISSGIEPFWTRPGLFRIEQKLETTPMSGSFEADRSDYYSLEDVPWVMYFDQARAFHGAYWHNGYGYPRSHGCVNMSPGDARWLFDWAQAGDWVYVHDRSGRTPTDPALYTAGGA